MKMYEQNYRCMISTTFESNLILINASKCSVIDVSHVINIFLCFKYFQLLYSLTNSQKYVKCRPNRERDVNSQEEKNWYH